MRDIEIELARRQLEPTTADLEVQLTYTYIDTGIDTSRMTYKINRKNLKLKWIKK